MKYLQLNEESGELKPLVKFLPGQPKGYRFDGQAGYFKLGVNPIVDDKGKPVRRFEITPIAFRVFEENLFGRERKELWFELFFVDDKMALSSIMFNNTSAAVLQNLQRELFYVGEDGLSICDVKLIVTSNEASNDKGKWFKAQFEYEEIPVEEVAELKELEQIIKPFDSNTLTDTAVFSLHQGSYFDEHIQSLKQTNMLEA
jgi:hypothetical protein